MFKEEERCPEKGKVQAIGNAERGGIAVGVPPVPSENEVVARRSGSIFIWTEAKILGRCLRQGKGGYLISEAVCHPRADSRYNNRMWNLVCDLPPSMSGPRVTDLSPRMEHEGGDEHVGKNRGGATDVAHTYDSEKDVLGREEKHCTRWEGWCRPAAGGV